MTPPAHKLKRYCRKLRPLTSPSPPMAGWARDHQRARWIGSLRCSWVGNTRSCFKTLPLLLSRKEIGMLLPYAPSPFLLAFLTPFLGPRSSRPLLLGTALEGLWHGDQHFPHTATPCSAPFIAGCQISLLNALGARVTTYAATGVRTTRLTLGTIGSLVRLAGGRLFPLTSIS